MAIQSSAKSHFSSSLDPFFTTTSLDYREFLNNSTFPPLRVCIVGCGAHTERTHLPTLSRIPQYSIESLIDIDVMRCRTLASRYHIGHYSTSIDDIPPSVEAAIVVLPHFLHKEISSRLMAKGLHVFCEKPMATSTGDAVAMIRSARKHGVKLIIGNVFRFYWTSRVLKGIFESNELGPLTSFHMQDGKVFDWPTSSGFYFDKKTAGGGVLIDTGAHVLDLLLWWLQDYPEVVRYQDDNFGGVESECHVELVFNTSVKGSIRLSRLGNLRSEYTLKFEKGVVSFRPYDPSGVCSSVSIDRDGKTTLLKSRPALTYGDYFKQQLQEFVAVTRGNMPSTVPADSVVPSIQVIDQCYQQASRLNLPWLCSNEIRHDPLPNASAAQTFKDSKVLISGAAGFIGGRVAERLYFDYGNVPRCMVRSFNRLSRLSHFPTEIVRADVLDYDSLVQATSGCDVVVHCAYGNTADDDLNTRINIQGTENLIQAALVNGIKRFIYLSSVEVYGKDQPAVVAEDTPTAGGEHDYARSKLAAEQLCLRYFKEKGLPAVILRLAVVYGPHSPIWTVGVVRRLLDRGFCLSSQFGGASNPVYIDDCIDAIFLSTTREDCAGETFIISGGETVTWNDYYSIHNDMLGLPPLKTAGKRQLQFYWAVRKIFDLGYNYLRPKYGDEMFFTYSRLRESGRLPNVKAFLQKGSLLDALHVYSRPSFYSIDKARRQLGFEPQYNLDRGMLLVSQWLNHLSQVKQ